MLDSQKYAGIGNPLGSLVPITALASFRQFLSHPAIQNLRGGPNKDIFIVVDAHIPCQK